MKPWEEHVLEKLKGPANQGQQREWDAQRPNPPVYYATEERKLPTARWPKARKRWER